MLKINKKFSNQIIKDNIKEIENLIAGHHYITAYQTYQELCKFIPEAKSCKLEHKLQKNKQYSGECNALLDIKQKIAKKIQYQNIHCADKAIKEAKRLIKNKKYEEALGIYVSLGNVKHDLKFIPKKIKELEGKIKEINEIKRKKRRNIKIITVFICIILFKLFGMALDNRAEHFVDNFERTEDGYIKGCEPIKISNNKIKPDNAIVFYNGLSNCSWIYKIDKLNNIYFQTNNIDIFLETLPYHGKNLTELKAYNRKKTLNILEQQIIQKSKEYKQLTIVSISFGGGLLVDLMTNNKIPKNTKVKLLAPAVFLKVNNIFHRNIGKILNIWRDYCDYSSLGCHYYIFNSADEVGKQYIFQEKKFHIGNLNLFIEMLKQDFLLRDKIKTITHPFEIIIAKDDSRVNVELLLAECDKNPNCTKKIYDSGKHILIWSKYAEDVMRYILDAARK